MDSGTSWKALPFPEAGVSVLAIDPQTSSTLYAAARGGIFYRSTDAGASWEAANSGRLPGRGYYSLSIDPQSPSTLYAVISWNGGWLVEKSTDGGGSWSEADAGAPFRSEPPKPIPSLTLDPHNPGTLYLGFRVPGTGVISAGLYKTTDGGKNWDFAPGPDGAWSGLVFDPKNPGTAYAYVCESSDVCTPLKSTDGGAEWKEITIGLPARVLYVR